MGSHWAKTTAPDSPVSVLRLIGVFFSTCSFLFEEGCLSSQLCSPCKTKWRNVIQLWKKKELIFAH